MQHLSYHLTENGSRIELQTSWKLLGNHKTASHAFILNFMVHLQYVQSQAK